MHKVQMSSLEGIVIGSFPIDIYWIFLYDIVKEKLANIEMTTSGSIM
jgi:hypothetical protein